MAYNICVIGNAFDQNQVTRLSRAAEENGCRISFCPDPETAAPILKDTHIIFGPSDPRSPGMVKQAPDLKWFASYYAGVEPLVQSGVLGDNILLTNGSGAYGVTISEHMIMVSLMLLRRMPEYESFVANKEFRSDLMIGSLYGANVVICGTGDIGSNFAKRLQAFCPSKVTGVNRTGRNAVGFDEVVTIDRLDEVLPQADLLALTLPNTPETDNLISRERIASMKQSAILVNVGRGNSIDQTALIEALEQNKLAGAALDVFRTEPIPQDDPAWNTRNLLVTPHCSGKMTMQFTRDTLVDTFCENLKRFRAGEKLLHQVDARLGY
jgi:phosphoglycerate dehydrogenase-like enzyme